MAATAADSAEGKDAQRGPAIPVLSGRVTIAEADAAFWAVYRIADRILPKARCRCCCAEGAGRSAAEPAS